MAKNRLERLMGMNERLVGIVILLTTSKPHLRLNFAKLGRGRNRKSLEKMKVCEKFGRGGSVGVALD
jgi:hypothetical protein